MIYLKNVDKNSSAYMKELETTEDIISEYLEELGIRYYKVSEPTSQKEYKDLVSVLKENAEWYLEHNGWKSYIYNEEEEEPDIRTYVDRYKIQHKYIYEED